MRISAGICCGFCSYAWRERGKLNSRPLENPTTSFLNSKRDTGVRAGGIRSAGKKTDIGAQREKRGGGKGKFVPSSMSPMKPNSREDPRTKIRMLVEGVGDVGEGEREGGRDARCPSRQDLGYNGTAIYLCRVWASDRIRNHVADYVPMYVMKSQRGRNGNHPSPPYVVARNSSQLTIRQRRCLFPAAAGRAALFLPFHLFSLLPGPSSPMCKRARRTIGVFAFNEKETIEGPSSGEQPLLKTGPNAEVSS